MTTQQWNQHQQHMDEHISWPATKDAIIKACEGSDVEPNVLEEIKTKLSDGNRTYTEAEVKQILVA
jgi:hypothetical protein